MDFQQYSLIFKVLSDVFLTFLVYLPWIVLQSQKPFHRGFYCKDESLSYPYKSSTISSAMYVSLGLTIPIVTMMVVEGIHEYLAKREGKSVTWNRKEKVYYIKTYRIPYIVARCYTFVGTFLFGAAVNQTITNIGKYSLGRLRPHFFAVCQPNYAAFSCLDANQQPKYITMATDMVCTGTDAHKLKQMRLSFPSGHSSLTTYTMLFLVLYLQSRMTWKHVRTLRTFIQVVLVWLAVGTCVSRISDYKHHWSDVVAGVILGGTVAILVGLYVTKLFKRPSIQELLPLMKEMHGGNTGRYGATVGYTNAGADGLPLEKASASQPVCVYMTSLPEYRKQVEPGLTGSGSLY